MGAPAPAPRSGLNPPIPPNPSCCRSRACERIPLRHRSNLQRKKQHRHSGIFRVADLGPGTMPRGKYPESPAPAGSHALISRTPTPGGMLHANLGLPRPPPRNFQPPLPQPPSNKRKRIPQTKNLLACPAAGRGAVNSVAACVSDHSRGQALAPATSPQNKRQQRPPTKTKTPRAVTLWRHACLTTPVVKPSPRKPPQSKRQQHPPTKTKNPRAAAPAAACVPGRSTGQHMLPQQPSKQTATTPPPQNQKAH